MGMIHAVIQHYVLLQQCSTQSKAHEKYFTPIAGRNSLISGLSSDVIGMIKFDLL